MRNEINYRKLVSKVLNYGIPIKGRNGDTIELFGETLKLDVSDNQLPMITGRKMHPRGVIGECLAFLQTKCNKLSDFTSRGCNYWKLWSDGDNLNIDYPIGDELQTLIDNIKADPHSRRHIIDIWNKDNLEFLSLPSCHYSYQFNIQGNKINLMWTQRSADVMIGVPSDMILATIYLKIVAQATGYEPNEITMNFGSCHIYREHTEKADEYLKAEIFEGPQLEIDDLPFTTLIQDNFIISGYNYSKAIKFELKA